MNWQTASTRLYKAIQRSSENAGIEVITPECTGISFATKEPIKHQLNFDGFSGIKKVMCPWQNATFAPTENAASFTNLQTQPDNR
jgi:hypothetical protein